jgi:hypothetical protein
MQGSEPEIFFFLIKEVARGGERTRGPLDFVYFLIFTTLPLSHSGSLPSFSSLMNRLKSALPQVP